MIGPQKLPVTALVLNSIAGSIVVGRGCVRGSLDERRKAHGLHYRKSIFGWVVTGVLSQVRTYQFQSFQVAVELDLARFWEVEEIPRVKPMSKENRQCGAL